MNYQSLFQPLPTQTGAAFNEASDPKPQPWALHRAALDCLNELAEQMGRDFDVAGYLQADEFGLPMVGRFESNYALAVEAVARVTGRATTSWNPPDLPRQSKAELTSLWRPMHLPGSEFLPELEASPQTELEPAVESLHRSSAVDSPQPAETAMPLSSGNRASAELSPSKRALPTARAPTFELPVVLGALSSNQHVGFMRRELEWLRAKHQVLDAPSAWHKFWRDEAFSLWLESQTPKSKALWAARYLPGGASSHSAFEDIKYLTPLPPAILEPYFRAHTRKASMQLPWWSEYLVALACQRLIAHHTAFHARFGPNHVTRIADLVGGHRTNKPSIDQVQGDYQALMSGPCLSELPMPPRDMRKRVECCWQVVLESLQRMQTHDGARAELFRLTPTELRLSKRCRECRARAAVPVLPTNLPPFHERCRCMQLSWAHPEMPQAERSLRLWACEASLHPRPNPFPVQEFLALGGRAA